MEETDLPPPKTDPDTIFVIVQLGSMSARAELEPTILASRFPVLKLGSLGKKGTAKVPFNSGGGLEPANPSSFASFLKCVSKLETGLELDSLKNRFKA